MRPFQLIIFDTYGVTFLRSPRYLEDPLVEEVDAASRETVDEGRLWARVARRHALSAGAIEVVQDRLAAKFCKNLDLWKDLPAWRTGHRLVLLHSGPAGLLARWRRRYGLDELFSLSVAVGEKGIPRADAALYARLAADAGLPPERCLLVDDERTPVDTARAAGLAAYRFGTVYGLRRILAEREAIGNRQ